jgi:recombination protein RecT
MTAPTKGTALAPMDALRRELDKRAPSYEAMLPRGYRPDRLITGALLAVSRNPALLECSPVSIAVALGQVAQLGLDVGLTAHLVPYGKACTMVADYKGYIELMCRAGARKVESYTVHAGDPFDYQRGTEPFLRHQPYHKDGAAITHAYAIVWFRHGETQFEVMTAEEIDAIRAKSKQWAKESTLPEWYARKTVIRRVAKYVPKSRELAMLLLAAPEETDATVIDGATGEVLQLLQPTTDVVS